MMKYFAFALLAASGLVFSACGNKAKDLEALKTYLAGAYGQQATDTLVTLLRENPGGPNSTDYALLLAAAYEEKMQDTISAISVYQAVVMAHPGSDAAQTAAARIPGDSPSLTERIEKLQAEVFDPRTVMSNAKKIGSYLNSCIAHVLLLPKDTLSSTLLNKAAENAYYTQQYDRALYLYEWFEKAYPNDSKAAQALFMRAFIYDNDLQKYETAGVLYEEFLKKYPDDDFADDAGVLLENLGKSPEEVIKSLEEKQVQ